MPAATATAPPVLRTNATATATTVAVIDESSTAVTATAPERVSTLPVTAAAVSTVTELLAMAPAPDRPSPKSLPAGATTPEAAMREGLDGERGLGADGDGGGADGGPGEAATVTDPVTRLTATEMPMATLAGGPRASRTAMAASRR